MVTDRAAAKTGPVVLTTDRGYGAAAAADRGDGDD